MRRAWLACLIGVGWAAPALAQPPTLPTRAVDIIQTLYRQHTDLARGNDDQRRALTQKMIEQIVCDFPNDGYSSKKADPNRPQSKDAIARMVVGTFWAWDWQNGTTREPQVYAGMPPQYNITGQVQIPLGCVNHLAEPPTPPVPPPAPPGPVPVPQPAPVVDLTPVLTRLDGVILPLLQTIATDTAETKAEVKDLQSTAGAVGKFVLTWVVPAVTAAIAAWRLKPDKTATVTP